MHKNYKWLQINDDIYDELICIKKADHCKTMNEVCDLLLQRNYEYFKIKKLTGEVKEKMRELSDERQLLIELENFMYLVKDTIDNILIWMNNMEKYTDKLTKSINELAEIINERVDK